MTKQEMSADDFNAWLEHMKISGREAARQLGTANDTITKYKNNGAPAYIGLACAALAFGLPAWRKVQPTTDRPRNTCS